MIDDRETLTCGRRELVFQSDSNGSWYTGFDYDEINVDDNDEDDGEADVTGDTDDDAWRHDVVFWSLIGKPLSMDVENCIYNRSTTDVGVTIMILIMMMMMILLMDMILMMMSDTRMRFSSR